PEVEGVWDVHVEMTIDGVQRSGCVEHIDDRGIAGMLDTGQLAARRVRGVRVRPTQSEVGGIQIEVLPDLAVELLAVSVRGRRVHATIAPGGLDVSEVRATLERGPRARTGVMRRGEHLEFSFDLPEPWAQGGHRVWSLCAVTAEGDEMPIAWPDDPAIW